MVALRSRRLERLFGARLDAVSHTQVVDLVSNAVTEAYDLDFKGELYGNADKDKIERAQLVVVNIRDDTEKDTGEALLTEVARLRNDSEVFTDVMGPRGHRIPITAVVANLAQSTDPGTKKALTRIRRVLRANS